MRVRSPANLLFVLVMMIPVVAVNGLLLHVLARQSLAASLPQTPGLITHSKVVSESFDNDATHGFEVRYTYEVRGVAYESSRYRHAEWSSSDKSRVEDFARRFPVGARVPVFYDPESPGDAVLVTGMDGMHVYLLMCMNTFNMLLLIGLRQSLRGDPDGFLSSTDTMGPLAVGIMAAGGASFLLTFVMGFVMALNPPLIVPLLAWVAIIATGVVFAMRRRAQLAPPPRAPPSRRELKNLERAKRRKSR